MARRKARQVRQAAPKVIDQSPLQRRKDAVAARRPAPAPQLAPKVTPEIASEMFKPLEGFAEVLASLARSMGIKGRSRRSLSRSRSHSLPPSPQQTPVTMSGSVTKNTSTGCRWALPCGAQAIAGTSFCAAHIAAASTHPLIMGRIG
jgi:hypothetical protein